MLGKLIKLDLLFGYKKFIGMAVLLVLFGVLMPLLTNTVASVGIALVFIVTIIVVGVMCIWLIVQHYHRNLFGAESYLMHTLPVKPYQMLLSKTLTTVFWFNFMIGSSLVMILLLARSEITSGFFFEANTWNVFYEILKGIGMINLNVIPMILAIFMGIALSTVAFRNKSVGTGVGVVFSVLGIMVFNWVNIKMAGTAAVNFVVNGQPMMTDTGMQNNASVLINLAVAAVFSILFFAITTYVMKRKLNLK